mmetsp:Transcript_25621/g.59500  ORF Transcript_25621/g.59500 Transcript_25621/m.59500 type:complete len:223 (+) Transcript_25621:1530-2198(+)
MAEHAQLHDLLLASSLHLPALRHFFGQLHQRPGTRSQYRDRKVLPRLLVLACLRHVCPVSGLALRSRLLPAHLKQGAWQRGASFASCPDRPLLRQAPGRPHHEQVDDGHVHHRSVPLHEGFWQHHDLLPDAGAPGLHPLHHALLYVSLGPAVLLRRVLAVHEVSEHDGPAALLLQGLYFHHPEPSLRCHDQHSCGPWLRGVRSPHSHLRGKCGQQHQGRHDG